MLAAQLCSCQLQILSSSHTCLHSPGSTVKACQPHSAGNTPPLKRQCSLLQQLQVGPQVRPCSSSGHQPCRQQLPLLLLSRPCMAIRVLVLHSSCLGPLQTEGLPGMAILVG